MELQTIINIVFAVAFVGYVVWQRRNPTFNSITCKSWHVVDADRKSRISAGTLANGNCSVIWNDKNGEARIMAAVMSDGTVFLPTEDFKNLEE